MESPMKGIASQFISQNKDVMGVEEDSADEKLSSIDEKVTPEEQAAFDKASTAAMSAIFEDDNSHAAIVKSLKDGASQPAKTIAQIVTSLFAKIDKDSGGKMPVSVMYGVVEDIADQVIELAEVTGAVEIDEVMKGKIAQELVADFGQMYDIPQEDLQELIGSFPEKDIEKMVMQQQQIAGGGDV